MLLTMVRRLVGSKTLMKERGGLLKQAWAKIEEETKDGSQSKLFGLGWEKYLQVYRKLTT